MLFVTYEASGGVGVLTVNRPQALNALNSEVIAELTQLLDEIASSDARCVIVTGAGEKAFVAGADIAEMKEMTRLRQQALDTSSFRVLLLTTC